MKSLFLKFFGLCLIIGAALLWQSEQIADGKITQGNADFSGNLRSSANQDIQAKRARAKEINDSPIFSEFDERMNHFVGEVLPADYTLNQTDENLIVSRRQLLEELIQLDPQAALAKAITVKDYARLPSSITANLEKPFSSYGDFNVYVFDEINSASGKMSNSRIEREIVIGGSRYKAVVYGRREAMTSKNNIPLRGIIIGDTAVLDEDVVRKLDASEFAESSNGIPTSNDTAVAAEVGGKIINFSNQSELDNFVNEQMEWESKIGPARSDSKSIENQLSPWTEGVKKVLFIRVDFPDRPGVPIDSSNSQPLTEPYVLNLMNNAVSRFYVNSSYGKTSLQTTVTPVLRVSQPQSYYTQNFNNTIQLQEEARAAARAAGFETNSYELDLIAFSNTQGFGWAGIASLGGKGMWINGAFAAWVLDHEFGHNYGLDHASAWHTTDGTIIGQGNDNGGGYTFDVMGGGVTLTSERNHFNVRYKRQLDWLTDANVQSVSTDGTYRIFAQDSFTSGGIRALKIKKDSVKNYWVEFRQLFTNQPTVMNGAIISWDYLNRNPSKVQLLDMTPNTRTPFDEPLQIGQSFYDDVNRIKITAIGKGNTVPESLDIKVEVNVGCTFTLGQTTQNISASGGDGIINVNTQSGCNTATSSQSDWIFGIKIDEATNAIYYTVSANYGSQPRSGIITVAGQTFTVNQSASATVCAAPPSGMVAWWRGEGNTRDETGTNNGTIINNISFGAGKIGGGFKAASIENLVQVPDSPSLALTTSMTFEGWIRLDANEPGRVIIERRDDTAISGNGAPSYIVHPLPTGELVFSIYTSPNTAGGVVSPDPLPIGQFVHFAATRDEATSQVKLFINGNLVRQITMSEHPQNLNPNAAPRINIGNINGVTDELSVYNRALSDSEIQSIYNAGTAATGAIGKCLLRTAHVPFDFDGDGKSDVSVFRPSNGVWYLNQSANGFTGVQFGVSTDKIVPADYDGDGKTDIAVFRNGIWYLQRSTAGFTGIQFGQAGDIPVPGDYDGDGKADIAVFRPTNGTWYLLQSTKGFNGVQFGISTDKPVAGDYDGDGKTDIAVVRQGNGVSVWYVLGSSQGFYGMQFGASSDKLVPADYDGDGKTDIAVYRPSNGVWYLNRSQAGFTGIQFGIETDLPAPADYDGDGKSDVAVYRNDTWFIQRTMAGFTGLQFGGIGDQPVPNAFVP